LFFATLKRGEISSEVSTSHYFATLWTGKG